MSRSALAASVATVAVLAAAAVSGATGPSPVATADAAAPFSLTKKQFTTVQKVSIAAVKRSNANTKAIAALQATASTAGAGGGTKGDPGPAGGFDPTKVSRVTGNTIALNPLVASNSATVACPAGAIAIGGGWLVETAADDGQVHVSRSYPVANLSNWSFRFRYTGPAPVDLTPYAVCAGA